MKHSVAIVNVGTEIVDGDVVNSNAAWLAKNLTAIGFQIKQHISVPDDTDYMLQAFAAAESTCDYIFVTGGLGPTTDDFTRDVLAQYLGLKLNFNQESWERVEKLLNSRRVPISDINKRQCFFPESAEIFPNLQGTADGFRIVKNEKHWTILPGPPKELRFLWNQYFKTLYEKTVSSEDKLHLATITTFGESESKLGEIVENLFKGIDFQIGYRARVPFVDLKFWYKVSQKNLLEKKLAELSELIEPFLVSRDGIDHLDKVLTQFYFSPQVQIIDAATLGILTERLFKKLAEEVYSELRTKITAITFSQLASGSAEQSCTQILRSAQENFVVVVTGIDENNLWCLGVKSAGKLQTHVEKLKFSGREFDERNRKTITELAFIYLSRILNQSTQSQKGH